MKNYVLVTGASSGIGREMSLKLAATGKNIIAASRNTEKLGRLKEEIEGNYDTQVVVIRSDLSETGAAVKLYQECDENNLVVDVLINNAGQGMYGEAVDQREDFIERMITLNITSLTTLCTLFAREMKNRGYGKIMNIGSLAGGQPTPFFSSYAASKAYVLDFTVALHYELRRFGVSVTCFVPGFIKTDFDSHANINNGRYLALSEKNGMDPARVADLALKAMDTGKTVSVGGFKNAVISLLSKPVPVLWKAAMIRKMIGWLTA